MKHLLSAGLLIALCSCSSVGETLKKDQRKNHAHGEITAHEFSDKKISRFFKRNQSQYLIYSEFSENGNRNFTKTEVLEKVLEPNKSSVFYFHNKGANKVYSQYFEQDKPSSVVDSTFKVLFPKPINPETVLMRFWVSDKQIHGLNHSQAKDITYYKY